MKEGKVTLKNLVYGDVCARSMHLPWDDSEYEEFEKELLQAISECEE